MSGLLFLLKCESFLQWVLSYTVSIFLWIDFIILEQSILQVNTECNKKHNHSSSGNHLLNILQSSYWLVIIFHLKKKTKENTSILA